MRVSYAHTVLGFKFRMIMPFEHNIALTSDLFWSIPTALGWYRYGSGVFQICRKLLLCHEKERKYILWNERVLCYWILEVKSNWKWYNFIIRMWQIHSVCHCFMTKLHGFHISDLVISLRGSMLSIIDGYMCQLIPSSPYMANSGAWLWVRICSYNH